MALQVLVDGSACVVYAGGKIAMSTRLYDRPAGQWGVFINEGAGCFSDLRLSIL